MIKKIKIGDRFGRLVVTKERQTVNSKRMWECRCSCGNLTVSASGDLNSGHSQSCGCKRSDSIRKFNKETKTTHGMAGSREYDVWSHMITRCYKQDAHAFNNYGGRGIKVCDSWLFSFQNFFNDMGKCPHGLSIERIDNNGNYEPSNCKWATRTEQSNNKRTNRFLTYQGETKTMGQWSRVTGIPMYKIWRRVIKLKWSTERALSC